MDQIATILFLILYYIRPQEWWSGLNSLRLVLLTMLFGLFSLIFRDRGLRGGDIFKTPHDWAMLCWWLSMWIFSSAKISTMLETFNYIAYYIVVCHALTNVDRIKQFLGWWTFMIVAIAVLSLLTQVGFDPLDSNRLIDGPMKGRLLLALSIFRNPNALGHNVVPSLAMLYFFCIWRRPLFMKQVGYCFLILPIYCIYLTLSKGAYLSAAATVAATFTFGRPKTVQIFIVIAGLTTGTTLLYSMPRMGELESSKNDPAIQGRVAAFRYGYDIYRTTSSGVGFGGFINGFTRTHGYTKASHSSYVEIGTELGFPGFVTFWALFYACIRTLVTANTRTDEEERVRRILFVLAFSYFISSWMVDLGYRPTFFMFAGAIAAFHRHLLGLNERAPESDAFDRPLWMTRIEAMPASAVLQPAPAIADGATAMMAAPPTEVVQPGRWVVPEPEVEPPPPPIARNWNRFGWVDFALVLIINQAAVWFWHYAMNHF